MSEPDYDFLNEEAPDEVVPAEEAVATEPEALTVETPPEVPVTEAPTAPESREETVPLAALKAEREKRQKYERELAEYKAKQQEVTPPSFYEAPEQYLSHVTEQVQQAATQRLYAALEESARETYADYDEVFEEVKAHCAENPVATHKIMSSANPAIAAYKLGKQLREMKAMQDPVAYRAQIKAELLAELQSERQAKEEAQRKAAASIPPDLSAVRASKDSEVLPDDSLESILQSKR